MVTMQVFRDDIIGETEPNGSIPCYYNSSVYGKHLSTIKKCPCNLDGRPHMTYITSPKGDLFIPARIIIGGKYTKGIVIHDEGIGYSFIADRKR
jgi:hypothetical protein